MLLPGPGPGSRIVRCRAGHDKPERFGQGGTRGLWFIKVNVVRDAFAVNNREATSCDRWREAPAELRMVSQDELVGCTPCPEASLSDAMQTLESFA